MRFKDRTEAGRRLAEKLSAYANNPSVIVLALPRGGVPVAYEIATALQLPLDIFLVRKLGLPGNEEFAMGAVASGGICVLNEEVLHGFFIDQQTIEEVAAEEKKELERRETLYRSGKALTNLEDKTVILVDDGLATGATMRAALAALKSHDPARIVVAVPVAPAPLRTDLEYADEMVCLDHPEPFYSVSMAYESFPQTADAEVCDLLRKAGEKMKEPA